MFFFNSQESSKVFIGKLWKIDGFTSEDVPWKSQMFGELPRSGRRVPPTDAAPNGVLLPGGWGGRDFTIIEWEKKTHGI